MSTPEVDPLSIDTSANQPQMTATPEVDPLAADKAALAEAQAKLAADQALHDEKQAALDAATAAHADAHVALQADQAALDAAQAKLAEDQAALDAAKAAHAETVANAPVDGSVAVHPTVLADAEQHLHDMEQTAQKWGGDIGTDLRNLVGKLRDLFGIAPRGE